MIVGSAMKPTEPIGARVDHESLRHGLSDDEIAQGISEEEVMQAIKSMAEDARRRVVFNFSGALPGPPIEPISIPRKILLKLEHLLGSGRS
jgi:hypothetical protein